jgi:hypothetical protein
MIAHQCDFPYSTSILNSLDTTLSTGRLGLYEDLSDGNREDALKLYCWNMALSQSLFWPLHVFEISLRNAMADRMYNAYGDDWYEKIASFRKGNPNKENDEVKHVEKSKRKLDDDGVVYGHDAIVSAMSMGFWLGLLRLEYEQMLWQPLFSDIYTFFNREELFKKVNQIKRLRNNIAHHEPILIFGKGAKRELFKDYKLVVKMIRWLCHDTALWVEHHSSLDFFSAWNCCPEFFVTKRLTVEKAGDEASSDRWKF